MKRVFLDGRLHTLFITEGEEDEVNDVFPVLEALQVQASRIESLEKQNEILQNQERVLAMLLQESSLVNKTLKKEISEIKDILSRQINKPAEDE